MSKEEFNWILHDHAHCRAENCTKKDTCFRYKLYLEDLKSDGGSLCTYVVWKNEEQMENCNIYIKR